MKNETGTIRIGRAVIGLAMGMLLLLAGCMIVGGLLSGGRTTEESMKYYAMGLILVGAWLCAAVATSGVDRLRLVYCIGMGSVFFVCLMACTALFFGGIFRGAKEVGATWLLAGCGGTLAAMQKKRGKAPAVKPRKKRYR